MAGGEQLSGDSGKSGNAEQLRERQPVGGRPDAVEPAQSLTPEQIRQKRIEAADAEYERSRASRKQNVLGEEKNFATGKERQKTIDEILEHRYRYYVLDQNSISDFEYDKLERRLSPEDREKLGVGSSLKSTYPERIRKMFKNSEGQKTLSGKGNKK